ncbi:MAG: hypothetical protein A4S09_03550 [Proteobacteria bacterium SG_bin7]|nr:MAG: hypothetical protein A4S09_03550 [Proteobacteria bacterium SG_bin7]
MVFTSNSNLISALLVLNLAGLSPAALAVFESHSFINSNPVIIKTQQEPITLVKGKPSHLKIDLEISKDFRVFTDEVNIRVANQSRFKIQKHQSQPHIRGFDPISKKDRDFLQGTSSIEIEFTWDGAGEIGEFPLAIQLRYEACTSKVCISPKLTYLGAKVNVIDSTEDRRPSSLLSKVSPLKRTAKSPTGIRFQKYSENVYNKSIAQKKPILIDFYASWCESCERFKKEVFSHAEAGLLTTNFVTLSVDLSDPSDENALLREKFGVRNLPSVVFIDKNGKINHELTASEFEEASFFFNRLRFFIDD